MHFLSKYVPLSLTTICFTWNCQAINCFLFGNCSFAVILQVRHRQQFIIFRSELPQFFIVTQFSQSQLKSWVHSSRVNTASSVSLLVLPHSSRYVLNNKKLVGTYANFIRKSLQPLTTKARQWLLSDISQMFCPI